MMMMMMMMMMLMMMIMIMMILMMMMMMITSRHKLCGAIIANFWKILLLQTILMKDSQIIRTVHKRSNMTTLHGGGGAGRYFVLSSGNCPKIFGQDCSLLTLIRYFITS